MLYARALYIQSEVDTKNKKDSINSTMTNTDDAANDKQSISINMTQTNNIKNQTNNNNDIETATLKPASDDR